MPLSWRTCPTLFQSFLNLNFRAIPGAGQQSSPSTTRMWAQQQQLLCCESSRPASGRAGPWGARASRFSAREKSSWCFSLLVGLSEAEHLSYLQHLRCSDLAAASLLVIFHPGALKQAEQCPVLALVNQQERYQQPEEVRGRPWECFQGSCWLALYRTPCKLIFLQ